MNQPFSSIENHKTPPAHLVEIYRAREQRTYDLVRQSVDKLREEKKPVSLTTIATLSRELDPTGKGVSISSISRNEQANAYYKKYRTYKNAPRKTSTIATSKIATSIAPRIKPDRDLAVVRNRYLKMSREELVDRLLVAEQALAQQENLLHHANDELLTLQLSLEEAEFNSPVDFGQATPNKSLETFKQLKAKNEELKAQLLAQDFLIQENEDLKKQNQHLFKKICQLETPTVSKSKKQVINSKSYSNNQPDIPDIEY